MKTVIHRTLENANTHCTKRKEINLPTAATTVENCTSGERERAESRRLLPSSLQPALSQRDAFSPGLYDGLVRHLIFILEEEIIVGRRMRQDRRDRRYRDALQIQHLHLHLRLHEHFQVIQCFWVLKLLPEPSSHSIRPIDEIRRILANEGEMFRVDQRDAEGERHKLLILWFELLLVLENGTFHAHDY